MPVYLDSHILGGIRHAAAWFWLFSGDLLVNKPVLTLTPRRSSPSTAARPGAVANRCSSPSRVFCGRRVRFAPGRARCAGDRPKAGERPGSPSLWLLSLGETRESNPPAVREPQVGVHYRRQAIPTTPNLNQSNRLTAMVEKLIAGFRARAAGYFLCSCKESNQRKHAPVARRARSARSPALLARPGARDVQDVQVPRSAGMRESGPNSPSAKNALRARHRRAKPPGRAAMWRDPRVPRSAGMRESGRCSASSYGD